MKLDKLNELIRAKNDIEALESFMRQLKNNHNVVYFGAINSVKLPNCAPMKISLVLEQQINQLKEMIENA